MKRLLLCFVSFVILICYADRQQEDFLQAQHLAKEGKFTEALVLYNTIVRPGFLIWYNKGICLYELEKYCDALIAFKKAQLYADRSNYKRVEQSLVQVAKKGNYSFSFSWHDTIGVSLYYIPLLVIQILFLIMMIVTVFYLLVKPVTWKIIILCILTCMQGLYVSMAWYVRSRSHGVIVVPASGYTGPGKEYQAYVIFPVGSVVNVDKKEKSWYKIRNLNNCGWVEETALMLIEE